MWFLEAQKFLILALLAVLTAVLRALDRKGRLPLGVVLPILEVGVLLLFSWELCVFYLGYLAVVYGFSRLILRAKRGRKALFALLTGLCVLPLVLGRLPLGLSPVLFVGFAFNMLKAIDALYYVYYSGEALIPSVYVNFMLFLPVFTAGPVFRYRDFYKTFRGPRALDAEALEYAVKRLIRGFFKKVVLSALAATAFGALRGMEKCASVSLGMIVLSYAVLYFDLSGYSDIAIALGRVMGVETPENFKRPWAAPTFALFWRSWHSSVSDFIREHIYIVIAKKRPGRGVSGLIGLLTMVVMLLWHEFSLLYLAAGFYNGALLMFESFLGLSTFSRKKTATSVYVLRCLLVNFAFAVNTLIFSLPAGEIAGVLTGLLRLR